MKLSGPGRNLICIAFIFFGCEQSSKPLLDQSGAIRGIVMDSATLLPVDSVLVGWKVHTYPDSLLFRNGVPTPDSVIRGYNVRDLRLTDTGGTFEVVAFLSPTPPYPYEDMFAYKNGYTLWRFDSVRDRTHRVHTFVDSIAIKLVRNK